MAVILPTTNTTNLQDVPTELAEHILTFCHPRDVSRVAQTCKQFHAVVYHTVDQYLWRELFLLFPFDDLRKSVPVSPETRPTVDDVDWRGELQRRVFAESILLQDMGSVQPEELQVALATVVSTIHLALPSQSAPAGHRTAIPSQNNTWVRGLLGRSPVFRDRVLSGTEQQLCCQIRAYLALEDNPRTAASATLDEDGDSEAEPLDILRSVSRCAVYDLRKYTMKNLWGPYFPLDKKRFALFPRPQPQVDWEQVEHIVNVVVMNMREVQDSVYTLMGPKLGLEATRAYSAPGTDARTSGSRDWAGLEGVWRRFVCFMDYRELFAFNYSNLKTSLSPTYFNSSQFTEAIRLLEMRITLTEVDEPTELDYPGCPQLHFDGYARGLQSRNADVKGIIQRLLDGTIRWKFETIYDGVPQWSGEGIQIGNVCSAAGLAGIWSGVQHSAGDPAGPFLMWKIAEGSWLDKDRREQLRMTAV
ncbi:hypothetical protein EIP91_009691 [Steccherinum ochraceum]|uniref:F-box domain-containing protein n=1 Tax=Steccherinum ochraceum TaxID=92696 RepID=A0A4R0RZR4_9APHY|nr:hypothetical protein EIP91_009691 [Steccherinum ochraceum]